MNLRLPLLATLAMVSTACVDPFPGEPDDFEYRAVLRWTTNGIPHILADDMPSAAFGQGYAFARLNGCILADQIIKVRSERALFFGAGEADANIDSDFVHLHRRVYSKAEAGLEAQPQDVVAMLDGYVAGYNEYIQTRADELPCGSEPWLRPITTTDLLAHYLELAGLASARQLTDFMLAAVPPASDLQKDPQPPRSTPPLSALGDLQIGSNGWGIGAERSVSGRGMVLANPHFPWQGELKLYESHLRVPGQLDVYGASLMGVVGTLIGFNTGMAWTHTVSDGKRFTVYELKLDPTKPTDYLYDGAYRSMEADEYTIQVRAEDSDELSEQSRTMYRTHYGPVIAPVSSGLPWTRDTVFAFRDANENNLVLIRQFLGMNQAESLGEFQAVHGLVQGIPWVNTISASAAGEAWYADTCPTPNLSADAIARWRDASSGGSLVATLFYSSAGVVVLDGSDSRNEWVEESGSREPGLVPYGKMPKLQRADFVFNANDSYWSTHPAEALEGYSPLHGEERTGRTPRTRMNAVTLTETGEGTASGADGLFDLEELRLAALSNRGMVAELLRDQVVGRCDDVDSVTFEIEVEGGFENVTEDLGPACDVLAAWDRRLDIGSVGAVVWREFVGDFPGTTFADSGQLFAASFDYEDWVGTPNSLAAPPEDGAKDRILEALGHAVRRLRIAGIAVDAPLRDAQYTKKYLTRLDTDSPMNLRDFERIPIGGGGSNEGVTNLIQYSSFKTTREPDLPRGEVVNATTDLTTEGYVVNYGTSFIMTTEFTDDGPKAFAFVTYGQSDDPLSPYHSDQTRNFSEKRWREVLFTEAAIAADAELAVEVIFGF